MSEQEAIDFFTEVYKGKHHFPSRVKSYGDGWCINHRGDLATFDTSNLTRLVFLAHDYSYRVEIQPCNMNWIRIVVHKRATREGGIDQRHPSIETALAEWRKYKQDQLLQELE